MASFEPIGPVAAGDSVTYHLEIAHIGPQVPNIMAHNILLPLSMLDILLVNVDSIECLHWCTHKKHSERNIELLVSNISTGQTLVIEIEAIVKDEAVFGSKYLDYLNGTFDSSGDVKISFLYENLYSNEFRTRLRSQAGNTACKLLCISIYLTISAYHQVCNLL